MNRKTNETGENMSYHDSRLQQDLINILGRAVNPLTLDEIIHKVTNEGYKSQRNYTISDIMNCFNDLLETGFIEEHVDKTYQWRE